MMDVFRHVGRGELSGFAGGAAGNRQLEQSFYLNGAYTESDLQAQVDRVKNSGPRGAQAYQDMTDYLAGLNQYIADVKAGDDFPGEYDLTGNANILTGDGIQNFQPTDLVAIGTRHRRAVRRAAAATRSPPRWSRKPPRPSTAPPGRPGLERLPRGERPRGEPDAAQRPVVPVQRRPRRTPAAWRCPTRAR